MYNVKMQIMQYVIGCTWIRIRNKYRMFIPNKHVILYLSFVNSKNPDDYENSIVIVSQGFFVTCIQGKIKLNNNYNIHKYKRFRSIPGFSKNNNKYQPPGWAFGCSRNNKSQPSRDRN